MTLTNLWNQLGKSSSGRRNNAMDESILDVLNEAMMIGVDLDFIAKGFE
jgi:hypothetical protein